jgi:hypothetical protein
LLAYLFWHRPRPGVEPEEYEEAQRGFHARIEVDSACFRVEALPWQAGAPSDTRADRGEEGGSFYEDWYLVDDWRALGELNAAAVDARHRDAHDRAAAMAADGWGGLYASVRGPASIPGQARWIDKPRGVATADLLAGIPKQVPVWQRQMVLGPAPELCLGDQDRSSPGPAAHRAPVFPRPPRGEKA